MSSINYILFILHTKQSIQFMQLQNYSLFRKKRTFNSDFFRGPPGGVRPKIHMADYVNVNCWPPFTRGATEIFGIKCAFLLE